MSGGSDVLLQARELCGARNGNDPRLLGQQLGERDLRGRRLLPGRRPFQVLSPTTNIHCSPPRADEASEKLFAQRRRTRMADGLS